MAKSASAFAGSGTAGPFASYPGLLVKAARATAVPKIQPARRALDSHRMEPASGEKCGTPRSVLHHFGFTVLGHVADFVLVLFGHLLDLFFQRVPLVLA